MTDKVWHKMESVRWLISSYTFSWVNVAAANRRSAEQYLNQARSLPSSIIRLSYIPSHLC